MDKTQDVVGGIIQSLAKVSSGVPQVLILLLFLTYIIDITYLVKHSNIRIFADDSKIQKFINEMGDWTCFHVDLLAVIRWAEKNNMLWKEDKFELINSCTLFLHVKLSWCPTSETWKQL